VSVLDQLGYRASLQVITGSSAYNRRFYDSRQRAQIGWSWYQDYPAPSDFIGPLLTCQSFIPDSPGNLNAFRWPRGGDAGEDRRDAARICSGASSIWLRGSAGDLAARVVTAGAPAFR